MEKFKMDSQILEEDSGLVGVLKQIQTQGIVLDSTKISEPKLLKGSILVIETNKGLEYATFPRTFSDFEVNGLINQKVAYRKNDWQLQESEEKIHKVSKYYLDLIDTGYQWFEQVNH